VTGRSENVARETSDLGSRKCFSLKLICIPSREIERETSLLNERRKFGLSLMLLLFALVMLLGRSVYSQGSLCYFTSSQVAPGQGDMVPEGQPVQFTITLTGSCPSPGLYTFRADLTNPSTAQTIATGRVQSIANGQFTVQITESAVAPAAVGTWNLQLSAYVLFGGAVVSPASQQTFGLSVVPYTATSTVQTTESTTQPSSETASTQSTAPSQTTVTTEQSTSQIQTTQTTSQSNAGLASQLQLVLAGVVILLIVIVALRARREKAKRERTRVY
jgi:hypothetical protein